jgi:hypothetical protein
MFVVNGTIVSQNQNKRKIEEVQAKINDHSISYPFLWPLHFWQSPKAHAIFHSKEGETVLEGIEKQINVLHEALSSYHSIP